MPPSPELLIGTYGWDNQSWSAVFYPEELPADWRFAYYSNRFRSVLVPSHAVATLTAAETADWVEDCDAQFRFVLELPADLDAAALERLRAAIRPLARQLAGLLLHAGAGEPSDLATLSRDLGPLPCCVETGDRNDGPLAARILALGMGVCWRGGEGSAPRAGGSLLVVRSPLSEARAQRRLLEAAAAWQRPGAQAAIFFDTPAQAEQARTLAELMGV